MFSIEIRGDEEDVIYVVNENVIYVAQVARFGELARSHNGNYPSRHKFKLYVFIMRLKHNVIEAQRRMVGSARVGEDGRGWQGMAVGMSEGIGRVGWTWRWLVG
jgi:hypothetical protein